MRVMGITLAALVSVVTFGCAAEVEDDVLDDEDADGGAVAGEYLTGDGEGETEESDPGLRARVCAGAETVKGIDVSKWQGTIDWAKVKNQAGVHYAFIRVSDGVNTRDAKFAANWAGTKNVGIIRGAYQFFRPSQNVTTQADMMIDALGGAYTPGDLPPVIDVEDDGGLAPATVAARVRTWVDRVEGALGVKPIVYTGKYFWRDEVGSPSSFAENPLWIAQYTSLCPDIPAPWAKWTFWQYTDRGTIAGIAGGVDTNRFNGSLAELRAYAMGTPVTGPKTIDFRWARNSAGSYDFTVEAPAGTAKVELRVENYLIGAPVIGASGVGTLRYKFNVATPNRAIEARGLDASGAVVSLGNGIIDSQSGGGVFVRQTDEHEYEIGWAGAASTWKTLEVTADGTPLTDLDSGTTRSARGAVRYKFNNLGNRALVIKVRSSSGTVLSTFNRTLAVR